MAGRRDGGGLGPSNSAAAPRAMLLIIVAVVLGAALLWKGLDDGADLAANQPSPTTTAPTADGSGDATPGDGSGDATPDDGSGDATPGDGSGDATPGDGSGDATPDDGSGDATPGDGSGDTTTTTTLFPTSTEPPSEVQVLVANGSGTARAAGAVSALLAPKGYATLPPANAQPTESTMIYFRPGMVNEARAVMAILAPDSPDLLAQIPPTGLPVAENALDRLELADVVVILGADDRISTG